MSGILQMTYFHSMLAALLTAQPAMVADATFQGHAIEVDGASNGRPVLRVSGKRFAIPGSPEQIVDRAQACLSRRHSSAGVVSVDRTGGRLVAVSRVPYHEAPSPRLVKAWLTVQAGQGHFSVVLSKLAVRQGSSGEPMEEVFQPLALDAGFAWEPAVAAVIGVEQALVDCLFA